MPDEIPPPSKGELLTHELFQSTYKGSPRLSLAAPNEYSCRFHTSESPSPLSSLPASLTKAHSTTDTALYVLPPHFSTSQSLALFDRLWAAWYPTRPFSARPEPAGKEDWAQGSRFFGVPVRLRDAGEGEGPEAVLKKVRDLHVLLARRVREMQRSSGAGKKLKDGTVKKGPAWYEEGPGKAFEGAFVVAEGVAEEEEEGWKADGVELLVALRRDRVEESGLRTGQDGWVCSLAGGQGGAENGGDEENWDVWRMPLAAAVRLIAKIDDAKRLEERASLSEQYVRRFGVDGKQVLVGCEEISGIVGP